MRKLVKGKSGGVLVLEVAAFVAVLEAMVCGYFRREVFTGCFVVAAGWPGLYKLWRKEWATWIGWAVCCVGMGAFTVLPVVKVESESLM